MKGSSQLPVRPEGDGGCELLPLLLPQLTELKPPAPSLDQRSVLQSKHSPCMHIQELNYESISLFWTVCHTCLHTHELGYCQCRNKYWMLLHNIVDKPLCACTAPERQTRKLAAAALK